MDPSSSSVSNHGSRRGPIVGSRSTTTTSPTRTLLANNTRTAPRPLRRSGSEHTGKGLDNSSSSCSSSSNSKATTSDVPSQNDGHRYSSHYFPGEESIVLHYPNQWHDGDTVNGGGSSSVGVTDLFPRFPPPPNHPPPVGGFSTTNNHPSALLGRTIENGPTSSVSGRESVDRSGVANGRGSGNGSDSAGKITRHSENRNGMMVNNNVKGGPLNRKLGPEHPDAIDTTSGHIMDATNVINSKTLGGKVSNNAMTTAGGNRAAVASRRYGHNTLGFQQRRGLQQYHHRHSTDMGNEDVVDDDDDGDDDGGGMNDSGCGRTVNDDEDFASDIVGGQQQRRQQKLQDGASCRSANSNKLFNSNDNSNRAVIREASLGSQSHLKHSRTPKKTNTKNNTTGLMMNGTATTTAATLAGRGGNHNPASHSNGGGGGGDISQWQRSNIAATMERYEPSTSSSSISSFTSSNHPATTPTCHHQDYSYAYYEPGAPMRHSNMHSPVAGPSSTAPPPNSIRALLAKGSRNNSFGSPSSSGSSRHASSASSCTPRCGPHENIYEEIGSDGRVRMVATGHQHHHNHNHNHHHQSMFSLDPASVEEEFRRVQNRHERTLEELNLSVEAMLMPSHEDTVPVIRQSGPAEPETGGNNEEMDFQLRSMVCEDEVIGGSGNGLGDNESAVGSSSHTNGDLDSGFSGSSSGTSYVGSLRYQRTGSALSNCCPSSMTMMAARSPNPNELQCRYTSGPSASTTAGGGFPPRLSSMYASSRSHNFHTNAAFSDSFHGKSLPFQRSAEDPGPSRAHIVNLRANHMYSNCIAEAEVAGPGGDSKTSGRISSFWSRKGWRLPGFSSMTSVIRAETVVGNSLAIAGGGGTATNALCFGRHPSP